MNNSKKLLNLIALVVLVSTNIFSPLSYATAGEEDKIEVSSQVESEETFTLDDNEESTEHKDSDTPMGYDVDDTTQNDKDTQDSSSQDTPDKNKDTQEGDTQDPSADKSSSDGQDDTQDENDKVVEDLAELEDMPMLDGTPKTPIDILFFDFEKTEDKELKTQTTANVTEPYGHVEYDLNGNEHFEAQVITISTGGTTITILDRNLGATTAGTGCKGEEVCYGQEDDSIYGYHFQRGNNHGFKPCTDTVKCKTFPNHENKGTQLSSITYNSFYTDPVFRIGNDNWLSDDSVVNLWGGSMEYSTDTTYQLDDETREVSNPTQRRGPCPENFHVPSKGELDKLRTMIGNSGGDMHIKLKIPFAGFRYYYDASMSELGNYVSLWSSSSESTSEPYSRFLNLREGANVNMDYDYRANASSVRCFYDEYAEYEDSTIYYDLTFNANGGTLTDEVTQSIEENHTAIKPTDPVKPSYTFVGWYENSSFSGEPFDFSREITGDLTLYAKWDITDLHLIFVGSGGTKTVYTMMDRNIGATERYNKDYDNQNINSYGYYFVNGVNTGYAATDPAPRNSNARKWNNSDTVSQGPCPSGYHVPNSEFYYIGNQWVTSIKYNKINDGNLLASTLLMPFAGLHYGQGSSSTVYRGTAGYYLSSNGFLRVLNFTRSSIKFNDSDIYSDHAPSLRCIKNSGGNDLRFETYGGNAVISVLAGGDVEVGKVKINLLGSGVNGGFTFLGWYTSDSFEESTKVKEGDIIDANSKLYAKYECGEGHTMVGDECLDVVPPVITIIDQPSVACGKSKTVRAEISDNYLVVSGQYAIIDSSTCNDSISATGWNNYTNNSLITLSNKSYNGKYICFRASDERNWTYEITDQIVNIDTVGPGTPTLSTPIDGVYMNDNKPTFTWVQGVSTASCSMDANYEIQICMDSSCQNIVQSGISTDISWTPADVIPDGIYYWRVRESDASEWYSNYTTARKIIIDTTNPTCIIIDTADVVNGIKENEDGSRTVTWNGKSYTLAGSDVGSYYWGISIPSSYVQYKCGYGYANAYCSQGTSYNDLWGGGGDTAANGYDSGNDRSERRGPCPSGWHVPSAGEWRGILNAWCYSDDNCTQNQLNGSSFSSGLLTNAFASAFGLAEGNYYFNYWSSTPSDYYTAKSFYRSYGTITFAYDYNRKNTASVRCMKDIPLVQTPSPFDASSWTGGNLTLSIAYLDEANQIQTGYSWDGITYESPKVKPVLDGGIYTGYVMDAAGNTGSCSVTLQDIIGPQCTVLVQPTEISLDSEGGTLTITCTDRAGVSTDSLTASAINYDSGVVNLSGAVVGGTSTSKTFTFTYTAKKPGETSFILREGEISDGLGNLNSASVESDYVTVRKPDKITLTFDANGGRFDDGSSERMVEYSGYLIDLGEFQLNVNQTVGSKKIEGAKKLYVTVLSIDSAGGDNIIYIYNYEKTNQTVGDDYIISGTLSSLPNEIEINGDTVGILVPGRYYYGTAKVLIKTKSEGYQPSGEILEPTREGHNFVGWYIIEDGEKIDFDPEVDEISQDVVLYAKYVCDAGYLEIDNECVKDTVAPVCERGEPSNTPLKASGTGTITLTCVDTGVGLSINNISASDILMSGNGVLTLIGGESDSDGGELSDYIIHEDGLITVYSKNFGYGITIQDKNLGATQVGTGCWDPNLGSECDGGDPSYGYYFQWGNNHGNYISTNVGNKNELLDADVNEWVNKGYNGDNDKFITFNSSSNYNKKTYDYRSGVFYTSSTDNSYVGESSYNNLWGGGSDNEEQENVVKGYDTVNHVATNLAGRQGPCGEGYHVPSAGEWQELVKLYAQAKGYTLGTLDGEKSRANTISQETEQVTNFISDLLLPLAGTRDYDSHNYIMGEGIAGDYWSSSPRGGSNPNLAWELSIDPFYYIEVGPAGNGTRANGRSIRCFKNTYIERVPVSSATKTYTFIYTAKDKVNGSVNFILPENIVKDSAGNSALTTTSTIPVVVDNTATYSVEYYIEKLDGTYEMQQTGTEVGTIDTEITAMPKEIEGFTFSGTYENNVPTGMVLDDGSLVLKLYYTRNSYDVEYQFSNEPSGHSPLPITQKYKYGESVTIESDATAPGYTFAWNTGNFIMPARNVVITGVFTLISSSIGSSGGGKNKVQEDDNHNSAGDENDGDNPEEDPQEDDNKGGEDLDLNENNDIEWNGVGTGAIGTGETLDLISKGKGSSSRGSYTREQVEAYTFAKNNGITSISTIEDAQMNGDLTRIQMAKMLSQYAINVLGQTPDTSKNIDFRDVTKKKNTEYDNGVTLAYQLGIMGQNMPNNKFRPDDEVLRAEFIAALSRMLYSMDDGIYKSTRNYYKPHMFKLYNEGIINKVDPDMKEKRGYVMIMLNRASK